MKLYEPFVSKRKNKKYSVLVKTPNGGTQLIHFGDSRYQQFHDKLKHYSHLDHNDHKKKKEKEKITLDTAQQPTRTPPSIGRTKFFGRLPLNNFF